MIKIRIKNLVFFILVILASIFGLIACDDNQQSEVIQSDSQKNEEVQNNNQGLEDGSESKRISLEKQFVPPNFGIDKFEVNADDRLVEFKISYKISDSLHDILKKIDSEYYFELKFPKNISSILNEESTELVPGAIMEFSPRKYTVNLDLNLEEPLTTSDITMLEQNRDGYVLFIYDQDKDPIHYFDDIELLSQIP